MWIHSLYVYVWAQGNLDPNSHPGVRTRLGRGQGLLFIFLCAHWLVLGTLLLLFRKMWQRLIFAYPISILFILFSYRSPWPWEWKTTFSSFFYRQICCVIKFWPVGCIRCFVWDLKADSLKWRKWILFSFFFLLPGMWM